ncbi:DUF2726 domain-containing protein [Ottowia sp.]|uniref:DUF2726 domain-containing protein n=1 Tax=Ottowia sp. TaxID=1898956 RepID=UPI0025FD40B7|nr:DUF2726 domain-containing protein [Ottowia sp.]MBK6616657.1 DUF2726 domain-containing protein [Ottowia sp.]
MFTPEWRGPWPFECKRILSEDQVEVLTLLQAALPDMMVFPGVALPRMLYVRVEGTAKAIRARSTWRYVITEKSVDFVVCNRNAAVVAVVDLKAPQELRTVSRKRQCEKERALEGARVKVVHWSSVQARDASSIRQMVLGG